MVVGDQGEACRNVEGFAYAHQSPEPEYLTVGRAVSHEEGYGRPHSERTDDEPFSAHAVSYGSGKRTYKSVDPEEYGHEAAEVHCRFKFCNVYLHGLPHCREHLSVHVIEQCHHPEQCHHDPRVHLG